MVNHRQELRSRLEFSSSEEWRSYVEANVETDERAYVMASGLTTLYLKFYQVRGIRVPEHVLPLIEEVTALQDPARTEQLNSINGELFAGMTQGLGASLPVSSSPVKGTQSGVAVSVLAAQLERENNDFALWRSYRRAQQEGARLPNWEQYIRTLLAEEGSDVIDFALSMATLGELMEQLRDQKKTVPALLANRILTVHRERQGPARAFATRILLQELLEVISPCTSA